MSTTGEIRHMPLRSNDAPKICEPFLPKHGGSIALAEKAFGVPTEGWLDLSTGINADAYPVPEVPTEVWKRLPDSTLTDTCIDAAVKYFGCSKRDFVVPGPGTQALIQWLPWLRSPSTIGIVGPTYTGHADAWQTAGHEVKEIRELPDWGEFSTVIVTNPNNPDGKLFKAEDLAALSEGQAYNGGLMVVDESFIDVSLANSVTKLAGSDGLIILRSFGKFFGLAGLRLGFALADLGTAAVLRDALGPWPISGPALEIGKHAMIDFEWQQNARLSLMNRSRKMEKLLSLHNFRTLGSTSLFLFGTHPQAQNLYCHLANNGVLIRAFESQKDQLRFGIPKDENDFIRTEEVLRSFDKCIRA